MKVREIATKNKILDEFAQSYVFDSSNDLRKSFNDLREFVSIICEEQRMMCAQEYLRANKTTHDEYRAILTTKEPEWWHINNVKNSS